MIVIAEKYGQLGNRLFLFAHFVAFALERGAGVADPAFDEYADFFPATRGDLFCRFPSKSSALKSARLRALLYRIVNRLANVLAHRKPESWLWAVVRVGEGESCDLAGERFVSLAKSKKFVLTQGWLFRDHPSLDKHAEAVRAFFRPAPEIEWNVGALIAGARADCDVLVGVHVRQGDYKNFLGGKYFYETAEYVSLMRGVSRLFGGRRVGFLVCSNAEHAAESFGGLKVTFGTGHFVEDMYSLARCDFIVGPPSTYTLWASFYGGAPLYSVEDPARAVALEDFVGPRAGVRAGVASE
jgi:hypothetical protein